MMITLRVLFSAALLAWPMAALAAPEGNLKIATGADATTFHPHVNALPTGNAVDLMVFEGLFRMTPDGEVLPDLAAEHSFSDDGMTFTVKIHTGHTFSNGNPVDAAAVAASFNQLLDPASGSIYAGLYASLGRAEATAPDTVVFHMKEKNGHVLMLLANTAAGVIDVKANTEMGAEYGRYPIGSGPYKVKDFIGGERFTLVPNETYQGDHPATLASVEFMTVPEDASRMALLETGEVQIVDRVPAESIEAINALDEAEVILPDSMFSISMEMVMKGPLEDARVRKALNISLDREGMVQGILGGLGTPSVGMVGPGTQDELRVTFDPLPYDPDQAKELLQEAGYGPGDLSLTITCPNGRYIKDAQICQALAGQWEAIGIDVTPQVMDLSNWSTTINTPPDQRTDNMGMVGRATAGIDFTLYRLFYTGVSANRTGFSDPKVDALLTEGRATSDVARQKDIYAEIQKIVWDTQPFVFLWYQKQAIGLSDKVQGFAVKPDETMIFDNVTLAD